MIASVQLAASGADDILVAALIERATEKITVAGIPVHPTLFAAAREGDALTVTASPSLGDDEHMMQVERELPTLLGIPKPSGDLLGVLVRTLRDIGDLHGPTVVVGVSALVLLFGGRKVAPRVPWGLVTVVAAVIVSKLLDLEPSTESVQSLGVVRAIQ